MFKFFYFFIFLIIKKFKYIKSCDKYMSDIMENIVMSLGAGIMVIWFASSLGTPLIVSCYVRWLGSEFGHIEIRGLNTLIDTNTGNKISVNTSFQNNLIDVGTFPITMVYGPFSILHSLYYASSATYNLLAKK